MSVLNHEAFKRAREGAGFTTLAEASAEAGVAIGKLSELEAGKSDDMLVSTMVKLCRAYGHSPDFFLAEPFQETESVAS